MKTIATLPVLLATTSVLACEAPQGPSELSALVQRIEVCAHLAGEFGSDDPEREQELNRSWELNRCDDRFLGSDIQAARSTYARQPGELAPLDDVLRRIRQEFGIEF